MSSEEPQNRQFESVGEAIRALLPRIDEDLASQDMPPSHRVTAAAVTFVEKFVIDTSGGKDDFWVKPWFKAIYTEVMEWYRERYGTALTHNPGGIARGVVMVFGTPFEVAVPLTVSKVEKPGETAWLFFPDSVRSDEEPTDWIVGAPNLSHLDPREREGVVQDVTSVANALRSIRIMMMGVEPTDDVLEGLLRSVLAHLEVSADAIVTPGGARLSIAFWELQVAMEKALKALTQQRTGSFTETHDLYTLYDRVALHGPVGFPRDLLRRVPRWQEMSSARYGLGASRRLKEALDVYQAALTIVAGALAELRRRYQIGGAGFLLSKAPWID